MEDFTNFKKILLKKIIKLCVKDINNLLTIDDLNDLELLYYLGIEISYLLEKHNGLIVDTNKG